LPRWIRAALALGCAVLATAGCVAAADPATSNASAPFGAAATSPANPANPATCADTTTWSCVQQQRFAAASGYAQRVVGANGYLSAVFTDRQSGQSWRLGPTQHAGWTASSIKLAIVTDLLRRQRSGEITLSAAERHDMDAMLHSSDEPASDRLWWAFGGADMLARFRDRFGMSGVQFVPGFTARSYWGFVKCTSEDLAALGRYVLERTDPADRAYLVNALRTVAGNQQWGVWAAGADQQPGNKDGWSFESDSYGKHWVADTVGFAGPQQRYVVAVMYQVDPSGALADGVHTVSDLVALLFGRAVPAPVVVPAPDG
jgi:hypothetical protein